MFFLSKIIVDLALFAILCLAALVLPANALPSDNVIAGKDGAPMVLVPEGEFCMGLKGEEPLYGLNPLRRVHLESFYIDVYEVTNALYHKCVRAGACKDPSWLVDYPPAPHEEGKGWYTKGSMEDYPVVGATWGQAVAYCRWAGKRLPSSAEWEKAARGTDGRVYPWGNEWDGRRANWNEGGKIDGFRKLAPIGSFPEGVSPYGVMDMAGNVREWTDNLVLKGGSWYSRPLDLRAGDPGHEYIVERDDDMGFRCAEYAGPVREKD